jgi:hypothetical protein
MKEYKREIDKIRILEVKKSFGRKRKIIFRVGPITLPIATNIHTYCIAFYIGNLVYAIAYIYFTPSSPLVLCWEIIVCAQH